MAGGKGLDKYRERMLADKRIRRVVDYPKLYEGFPGVKIRGGISYFIWDRDYIGPCEVQTIWDGRPTGPAVARHLDAYDILVRRNEAVPILEKVKAKREPTLDQCVSSRKPFGLATNFRGRPSAAGLKKPVKLFENQRVGWADRKAIPVNQEWIDEWKVLLTAVQGTSAAVETKFLSKPIIAPPGTACTETYLVVGHFENEDEAANCAQYLRTRFVRFLVSLRKATQHATRDVYSFVPDLPLNQKWTDVKLYKRYGLNKDEIAFIESQVAEHDGELFDEFAADDGDDE
jgi:site-specific DNA-methyltransferase (adenine-specific)